MSTAEESTMNRPNGRHPDDALPPKTLHGASGDRIVPAEFFADCPLADLSIEGLKTNEWGLSRGGLPVPDRCWTLNFGPYSNDDFRQVRWTFPEIFQGLFRHFEEHGRAAKLQEIRAALEIR